MKGFLGYIEIKSEKPIVQRPYHVLFSKGEVMQKEIERMLKKDITECSIFSIFQPINGRSKKREGDIRLYLDARFISKIIILNRAAPQTIDEILQYFFGDKYLSSLDLTSGYWQVELNKELRQCSAFLFNEIFSLRDCCLG